MHGGFAFLEVGTVRHKNQVNALVKIMVDFAISTVAYFLIGYTIAYGVGVLAKRRGDLRRCARASTRRASRSCASSSSAPSPRPCRRSSPAASPSARGSPPQALATAAAGRAVLPAASKASSGTGNFGLQESFFNARSRRASSRISPARSSCTRSAAGSALGAVLCLGPRLGRYEGPRDRASRRRRSRGWPWARGCCASAGSAST